MPTNPTNFLSLAEAGRFLGCKSASAVRRLVRQGELATVALPGGRPRIDAAELAALLARAMRLPAGGVRVLHPAGSTGPARGED